MAAAVLVINCGSSSLKFAYITAPSLNSDAGRLAGVAEKLGTADANLVIKMPDGTKQNHSLANATHASVLQFLADTLDDLKPDIIGHRVVHGGEDFSQACVITDDVVAEINKNSALAPLHNPANIVGIEAAAALFAGVPQVAVFDTAFHSSINAIAYRYPVPTQWYSDYKVRRYGFHGTSHAYVTAVADSLLGQPGGWVSLHLGNGCSAASVYAAKSIDTTMGLTPLEGLMMGTRSGDIDPGIHQYLCQQGLSLDDITTTLNKKSGLQGVSGLSNDMRTLIEAASNEHSDAKLAIDMFCYRVAKQVGALASTLPVWHGVVFTGGIGENAASIRAQIVAQLAIFGITLDNNANSQTSKTARVVSAPGSRVGVYVIPTDEEWQIACEARQLFGD